MKVTRRCLRSALAAAAIGFVAFLALVALYAAFSGVIEPQNRIDAFLLARPHHRHPLQLAAAAWMLHLVAGGLAGAVIGYVAQARGCSPWCLLPAFATGYAIALTWMMRDHGLPFLAALPAIGHALAVFAAAAGVLLARQLRNVVH
jgi:hypothetical protein